MTKLLAISDEMIEVVKQNKLPKNPGEDLCFYHWSPSKNRKSIEHDGLAPGRLSLQGDWRPPYVAFSAEPVLAWTLSGRMYPSIESWDLWMMNTCSQTSVEHWEAILEMYPDTRRHYIKEYRIYGRIFKRDLHYIGSRTQ